MNVMDNKAPQKLVMATYQLRRETESWVGIVKGTIATTKYRMVDGSNHFEKEASYTGIGFFNGKEVQGEVAIPYIQNRFEMMIKTAEAK